MFSVTYKSTESLVYGFGTFGNTDLFIPKDLQLFLTIILTLKFLENVKFEQLNLKYILMVFVVNEPLAIQYATEKGVVLI